MAGEPTEKNVTLLDLQRSVFTAELQTSEVLQLHLTSIVRLYESLGGGWIEVPDTTGTSATDDP